MGQIGDFWAQIQNFRTFLKIFSLDFSQILHVLQLYMNVYCMYVKTRIFPAYIFIFDNLSPFYSALHFQEPPWQKWCLKFRLSGGKLDLFWLGVQAIIAGRERKGWRKSILSFSKCEKQRTQTLRKTRTEHKNETKGK